MFTKELVSGQAGGLEGVDVRAVESYEADAACGGDAAFPDEILYCTKNIRRLVHVKVAHVGCCFVMDDMIFNLCWCLPRVLTSSVPESGFSPHPLKSQNPSLSSPSLSLPPSV